jgi:tRNA pseudouridine13 synthase
VAVVTEMWFMTGAVVLPERLPDDPMRNLACTFGGPAGKGRIRTEIDDFVVDEQLGFEPTGDGEHVFLHIEKRGENSERVAQQLVRYAGVPKVAVGYAGMKDRNAITTQWFSVHLPGMEAPNWRGFESETVRVLASCRHNRKLKKGALTGNCFRITVRGLTACHESLLQRLNSVAEQGVPNYFGPQRFGRDGRNVAKAIALFQGRRVRDRHRRGLYLSAARSYLFNLILSERVALGNWNRALAGDAMMLNGTQRYFKADVITEEIIKRVETGDIHPTGALWGSGDHDVSGAAAALESGIADRHDVLCKGLDEQRVAISRRSLRLPLNDFRWDFPEKGCLLLTFFLPAGGYATAVLRELIDLD